MSTSPNTVSAFMLSLSEFACLVSEQHYRFLSQSLNNIEHQIEQHQVERHLMELHITNLQQWTTQWCLDAMSTSPTSRTPSFSLTSKANPIDDPSTITNLLRTPLHTTFRYTTCHLIKAKIGYQTPERPRMGSKRNPIYVLDDDEVQCEGCWEEGHFIGDCN